MILAADRIQDIKEYYFSAKLAEIRAMSESGIDILNLGVGSPDLDPPEAVSERLIQSMGDNDIHKYQAYNGISEYREAISRWYQRWFDVELNSDTEILPLIGSKEGILHISMAYLNPADHVLLPDPGYPTYQTISRICDAVPKFYSLVKSNQYNIDIEQLKDMNLDRVKLMWLNSPHMPTGSKIDIKTYEALIALADKHNFLLCHDNPYAFLLNDQAISIMQIDGAKSHALELSSLSKHYNMAGWRIAALAASEEVIQNVLKFKSNMDSGMFKGIQLAAIAALDTSDDWIHDLNAKYQSRRQLIYRFLDLLECKYTLDQSGIFVWAKIPDLWENGHDFSDHLLTKLGIFVAPGSIFGLNGKKYIRVSLCQTETIINKAIERCK